MSAAYKCDGCAALFEHTPPLAVGDVFLTLASGKTRAREVMDFCATCAPAVLEALSLTRLGEEE